jgi:hypothetical protein
VCGRREREETTPEPRKTPVHSVWSWGGVRRKSGIALDMVGETTKRESSRGGRGGGVEQRGGSGELALASTFFPLSCKERENYGTLCYDRQRKGGLYSCCDCFEAVCAEFAVRKTAREREREGRERGGYGNDAGTKTAVKGYERENKR